MDSMMPASVALNIPSTAAEVTVGRPHWPAREAEEGVSMGHSPGGAHSGWDTAPQAPTASGLPQPC